jgi:hypothetical protein
MQGRWREAAAVNKTIIENFPNDVGAYNRLGRAYMELGEYALAREAYGKAIELDPYNAIAQKNLHRLSHLERAMASSEGDLRKAEPQYFVEEIGKAGVVNLYNLAPREVLARVVSGDKVYLRASGVDLVMENGCGEYLGQVEPRHGRRLIKLMEGGNRYTAAIVSSAEDRMTVIIREVYQDPSQAGRLSFPSRDLESPRPYVNNRLLRRGYGEEFAEESGYTIIGGEGAGSLLEESYDIDDKIDSEE